MARVGTSRISSQQGFTYLTLMFSIVVIGVAMVTAAEPWKTVIRRGQEEDLLARGIEIQQALAAYSASRKGGRVMPGEIYPASLEDLTRPPRPFLRKVYRDPVTTRTWDLIRSPTGGIMGVRSRSIRKPLKQHEFPPAVRHFDGLKRYRDWVFQHPNQSSVNVLNPMGMIPTGSMPPVTGPQSGPPAGAVAPGTSPFTTGQAGAGALGGFSSDSIDQPNEEPGQPQPGDQSTDAPLASPAGTAAAVPAN
ncbi:MAG: type II secretion system protein [Nitrospiraceae bacterium]